MLVAQCAFFAKQSICFQNKYVVKFYVRIHNLLTFGLKNLVQIRCF